MKIQINTDKNISGKEELRSKLTDLISDELNRYSEQVTRVEVHLSDENAEKKGINDIRCLLEARLKGRKPIAVSSKADSVELALDRSIDKLKKSLTTIKGRMKNYQQIKITNEIN